MRKTRLFFKANGLLDGGEIGDYLIKHGLLECTKSCIPGIEGLSGPRFYVTKPMSYIRSLWVALALSMKTAQYGEIQVFQEN